VQTRFPQFEIIESTMIENDQWTVYGSYNLHRPLYRYRVSDPESTDFYLSSRTGERIAVADNDAVLLYVVREYNDVGHALS